MKRISLQIEKERHLTHSSGLAVLERIIKSESVFELRRIRAKLDEIMALPSSTRDDLAPEEQRKKRLKKDFGLTEREFEIMKLLGETQAKNKDLARRLFISQAVVKFHLTHIYQKTGTSRRGELIALWYAYG
jgi:DNA-binding CsgD family transcriptional regulator